LGRLVSALFPYTTLFRSNADAVDVDDRVVGLGDGVGAAEPDGAAGAGLPRVRQHGDAGRAAGEDVLRVLHRLDFERLHVDGGRGDRKSTRLNSSHDQISY